MGVVVMARGGMAQPWEARQPLALGQHVASHAGLAGGQSIGEQIALQFRHARPVLHIEVLVRRSHFAIVRGQFGNGAFQVANRGEMLVQAHCVFFRKPLAQHRAVLRQSIQNAAFAVDPAQILRAEQTVEQTVGNLLRRQRPVGAGPTSCSSAGRRRRTPAKRRSAASGNANCRRSWPPEPGRATATLGPVEVNRVQVIRAHKDWGWPCAAIGIVEAAQYEDVVLESPDRSEARSDVVVRAGG